MQSFSWEKWHACCKSHVWTILCVRIAHVSKPLNWSAITTKYHKDNWTFFKIRYIYTKGRNLTLKIVYSIGLGGSQKKNETDTIKPTKPIFCFGFPLGCHNHRLQYAQAFPWAKLQACWISLALTEVGVRCFLTAWNGIKYQFQSVGTIRRMLYSFHFWMSLSLH